MKINPAVKDIFEYSYEDFELIETGEDDGVAPGPAVSRMLLKKVNNLKTGQWFTFQDEGTSVRIKLVLKLEDIKQLLFTNDCTE